MMVDKVPAAASASSPRLRLLLGPCCFLLMVVHQSVLIWERIVSLTFFLFEDFLGSACRVCLCLWPFFRNLQLEFMSTRIAEALKSDPYDEHFQNGVLATCY